MYDLCWFELDSNEFVLNLFGFKSDHVNVKCLSSVFYIFFLIAQRLSCKVEKISKDRVRCAVDELEDEQIDRRVRAYFSGVKIKLRV